MFDNLVPGGVKAAMKDSGAASADLWMVPIADIMVSLGKVRDILAHQAIEIQKLHADAQRLGAVFTSESDDLEAAQAAIDRKDVLLALALPHIAEGTDLHSSITQELTP